MYIVRWLMGHPIIAAWFLAIIAILLNVGNKNETDTAQNDDTKVVETAATSAPSSVTTAVETDSSAATKQVSSDSTKEESVTESTSATPEVESTSVTSTESATETSSGAVVDTTIVDSVNTTSRSYPEGLTSSTGQTSKETNTGAQVAAKSEETTGSVNTEVSNTDTAQAQEKDSDATISDLGEISNEEMLLMAREAYWNNGLEEAAQIYKQLIKTEPKVIEHRGELGNVYWRQGYPKKAAELYSEIAIPMIEQGNSERVANMVGFIGLFYPDRASEIHKRLQSAETKSQ